MTSQSYPTLKIPEHEELLHLHPSIDQGSSGTLQREHKSWKNVTSINFRLFPFRPTKQFYANSPQNCCIIRIQGVEDIVFLRTQIICNKFHLFLQHKNTDADHHSRLYEQPIFFCHNWSHRGNTLFITQIFLRLSQILKNAQEYSQIYQNLDQICSLQKYVQEQLAFQCSRCLSLKLEALRLEKLPMLIENSPQCMVILPEPLPCLLPATIPDPNDYTPERNINDEDAFIELQIYIQKQFNDQQTQLLKKTEEQQYIIIIKQLQKQYEMNYGFT